MAHNVRQEQAFRIHPSQISKAPREQSRSKRFSHQHHPESRFWRSQPRGASWSCINPRVSSTVCKYRKVAPLTRTHRIAGGETVATEIAGIIYYLTKSQKVYERLVGEIRQAFTAYADISSAASQRLPYLQAVIEEGLRIYPSGALGFPRKSPGIRVDGHWVPQGVIRLSLDHGAPC